MPRKKKTYEDAMSRLEEIVELLEKGNMPLEESLKLFEEGTRLSTFCYSTLKYAQQRVIEINEDGILEEE